jgi:hypothetical protein
MSFPLNDCTILNGRLSKLKWDKKDATSSKQDKGANIKPFGELLINEVNASSHASPSSLMNFPLDKDKLIRFTQIIRSQLNDYLFQIAKEDFANPGSSGLEDLSELYVSKIQHFFNKEGEGQSKEGYDQIIDHASKKYVIDPGLIRSVIRTESDFDRYCTSSKGAMGLMQLLPGTAKDMGVYDPYDPFENIMGGTKYLRGLIDRYDGDITLALAAYNWGMTKVERSPDKLPQETLTYILRVNKYYNETG